MGNVATKSEVLLPLGLSTSTTTEESSIVDAAIIRAEAAVARFLRYDPVQRTRTEFYPQRDYSPSGRGLVWEAEGSEAVLRRVAEAATDVLSLRHLPVRSISSLYIDYDGRAGTSSGAFGSDTLKTEGTDFWPNYDGEDDAGESICHDGILRSIGAWPTTPGTVKVVYVAGYTSDEFHGMKPLVDASPILESVVDEAVRRAKKALVNKKLTGPGFVAGPLASERLGDYSYTVDSASLNRLFGSAWDIAAESKERLNDYVNWGWVLAS